MDISQKKEEGMILAKKIAESHRGLFGETSEITEIKAGFNNCLFSIDDRYIVKICGNPEKENLFKTESRFYQEYSEYGFLPKLYCFDMTKTIIPYPYEIIEKIHGKTIYYMWFLWTEERREAFIRDLMKVVGQLHQKEYYGSGWAEKILSEIRENYKKRKNMFSEEEHSLLEKSFMYYGDILKECRYARIHNDLHLDNIILDKSEKIKLIDFNDTVIAPFDFEFRQLYMCREIPWRWADEEMDPYQLPKDYIHIVEYIKKYNTELSDLPQLEERMTVYAIWNEMDLLVRFGEKECAENVIKLSKKLLNIYRNTKK